MKEIHDKKSHDYAKDNDALSNFKFSAEIVKQFSNPIDQVFAGIIGIKLARLSELLNGKTPQNESIDDTFVDASNYFALWGSYYLEVRERKGPPTQESLNKIKKLMDDVIKYPKLPEPTQVNKVGTRLYFKEICTKCNVGNEEIQAKHAINFHSARFDALNGKLIYPDKTFFLVSPSILDLLFNP